MHEVIKYGWFVCEHYLKIGFKMLLSQSRNNILSCYKMIRFKKILKKFRHARESNPSTSCPGHGTLTNNRSKGDFHPSIDS